MASSLTLDQAATQLKVLAHPQRINIVRYLSTLKKEQAGARVTEIFTALELPQAISSQHLLAMKDKGLLKSIKIGTSVFYSIAQPWLVQVVKEMDKQTA